MKFLLAIFTLLSLVKVASADVLPKFPWICDSQEMGQSFGLVVNPHGGHEGRASADFTAGKVFFVENQTLISTGTSSSGNLPYEYNFELFKMIIPNQTFTRIFTVALSFSSDLSTLFKTHGEVVLFCKAVDLPNIPGEEYFRSVGLLR